MISNIYLYNHENLTYDLMDITEDNVLDIDEN
jgi:hypothetical protein